MFKVSEQNFYPNNDLTIKQCTIRSALRESGLQNKVKYWKGIATRIARAAHRPETSFKFRCRKVKRTGNTQKIKQNSGIK